MVKTYFPIITLLALALSVTSHAYEPFIAIGINSHSIQTDFDNPQVDSQDIRDEGYHFSVGIRNAYGRSERHLLGFGIDIDEVGSDTVIGYRALDYNYHLNKRIRFGGFFGAASIDTGLPQNGYYAGISMSVLKILWKLDLTLEFRRADGLARDRRPGSDPEGTRGDIFLDYNSPSAALTWRF